MLKIFKTDASGFTKEIHQFEKGCWIHLTNPSEQEKQKLVTELNIDLEFLHDALDDEEIGRIDMEENRVMLFVDIPLHINGGKDIYTTVPLGILIMEDYFVTVCLEETAVMNEFLQGKVKHFHTHMRTRFVLQILSSTSLYYLQYLKKINRKMEALELSLRRSMKNNELLTLLELQKSLVYFSTSLETNKLLIGRLLNGSYLKMYEEDKDLLEEVKVEIQQAIKMSEIYTAILGNIMNGFGSIISNNLNHVVKLLTAITIVITLPMVIGTYYGMNVALPFQDSPTAFSIIMIISATITTITALWFWKKKYF
ncbi:MULTISPECIES: magnesium transporter CorA family protein [unclassified Paenibacillus]|uniref:Magnesium transporter CorA family protein n=2 Tax=Bacillati TaxID=1783272 RepID=A0ABW3Q011_9BACL|nr:MULTISPECIES: magnesium transporter CorA family protein [unclassified Paenibacillus]MCM3131009.1 magnesium transporter CorA family protein [Paenibacillus sp. MER 78]SDX87623.1 magnesium transporter [Paenibacillus sp. PDC88]